MYDFLVQFSLGCVKPEAHIPQLFVPSRNPRITRWKHTHTKTHSQLCQLILYIAPTYCTAEARLHMQHFNSAAFSFTSQCMTVQISTTGVLYHYSDKGLGDDNRRTHTSWYRHKGEAGVAGCTLTLLLVTPMEEFRGHSTLRETVNGAKS